MPSPFDCIIDGRDEPIAIFRVDCGNDLVQGNPAATQCRIETKTIREGRIDGELVRRNIPDPGADALNASWTRSALTRSRDCAASNSVVS
ncbi:hypothetical protein D3C87_1838020 [compost metagenome]